MKTELLLPSEVTCGYFDCSCFESLRTSPPRRCETFEIEYFLEDGKNTYLDGVAYPIRRNYVLICYPGEERYSELPFRTKYVKFVVEGKLARILKESPRYFYLSQSFEANALLDEIITTYTLRRWDEICLQGKILNYISLLLKNAQGLNQIDSYQNEIVIAAQEYIKEHYREPILLRDMAKSVNLSPNYFHTLFSRVCGISPREYLEEYRINAAKQLLLTTHLTVREIAERCGFRNQQYLTSVFRNGQGCTPTQFKRNHQNQYFI